MNVGQLVNNLTKQIDNLATSSLMQETENLLQKIYQPYTNCQQQEV